MSKQPHVIEIQILPDGQITGQIQGVAGPSCTSLTAWLDELGNVIEDRKTPDYYKPQGATVKIGK